MDALVAPVHRSILFPPLVFGMPRKLFVLIGIITLALVVSMGQVWFIAVSLVSMLVARRISKEDIYAFEIYLQLFKFPKELD